MRPIAKHYLDPQGKEIKRARHVYSDTSAYGYLNILDSGTGYNEWRACNHNCYVVRIPRPLYVMLFDYCMTPSAYDGNLSGVIADWIEEFIDDIVAMQREPHRAMALERLTAAVGWYRQRSTNPKHLHNPGEAQDD